MRKAIRPEAEADHRVILEITTETFSIQPMASVAEQHIIDGLRKREAFSFT